MCNTGVYFTHVLHISNMCITHVSTTHVMHLYFYRIIHLNHHTCITGVAQLVMHMKINILGGQCLGYLGSKSMSRLTY